MLCNRLFALLVVFVVVCQVFCLKAGNGQGGKSGSKTKIEYSPKSRESKGINSEIKIEKEQNKTESQDSFDKITNNIDCFVSGMFNVLVKHRETGENKGLYEKIKLVDTENDLTGNDLKQLVSNNNKNLLNIFEKYLIDGCILKQCITESCDQICLTIINKRKETMYVSLRFQFGFGNSYDGIFYSIELLIKEIIVKEDTHKPEINLILKVNLI